ncbi:unnamed protein product [Urochloa humidicola]
MPPAPTPSLLPTLPHPRSTHRPQDLLRRSMLQRERPGTEPIPTCCPGDHAAGRKSLPTPQLVRIQEAPGGPTICREGTRSSARAGQTISRSRSAVRRLGSNRIQPAAKSMLAVVPVPITHRAPMPRLMPPSRGRSDPRNTWQPQDLPGRLQIPTSRVGQTASRPPCHPAAPTPTPHRLELLKLGAQGLPIRLVLDWEMSLF